MKKLFVACVLSATIIAISASELGALGCGGPASATNNSRIFRQRAARDGARDGLLSKIRGRESTPIINAVQKVRDLVKSATSKVAAVASNVTAGARTRRNQVNYVNVDSSQGRILIQGVSACQGGACPTGAKSFEF